jgi:hypothetical protein
MIPPLELDFTPERIFAMPAKKKPAAKTSKPKTAAGAGAKRRVPAKKREPAPPDDAMVERHLHRVLLNISSDLRKAFRTIKFVIDHLTGRTVFEWTDDQRLEWQKRIRETAEKRDPVFASMDSHILLMQLIQNGYPMPADLKARSFDEFGKVLADTMRLFVRRVDKKNLSPNLQKIYADRDGTFYQRSLAIGEAKRGNQPNVMVEAFCLFVCFGHLINITNDIDKALFKPNKPCDVCGDLPDYPDFEFVWEELVEPYARKRWDDFVEQNLASFGMERQVKDWGWTKGKWNVQVKSYLRKWVAKDFGAWIVVNECPPNGSADERRKSCCGWVVVEESPTNKSPLP